MKAQLASTVKRGKLTAEQAKLCFSVLKPTTNIEDLKICDLVRLFCQLTNGTFN